MLALEFDRSLSRRDRPFRVSPAHHQALARRESVALVNERGERATLRLVVDIPDHVPEPRPDSPQNARASNPFALEPDGSCALWLVDASRNLIWKVDICENTSSTLTTFPPTTNTGAGRTAAHRRGPDERADVERQSARLVPVGRTVPAGPGTGPAGEALHR